MALRLRRGTDAERLLITPVDGELIYTTDTKLLYVGDGTTAGGVAVDNPTDLQTTQLNGLTDVDTGSVADNQVLTWIAGDSTWKPTTIPGIGSLSLNDLTNVDINSEVPSSLLNTLKWNGTNYVPGQLNLGELNGVYGTDSPNQNDILAYDGFNFTPFAMSELFNEQQNYRINIVGDDSTIIVNTDNNNITGNFFGNVTGDTQGTHTGDVVGNVTGNTTGLHTGPVDGDVIGSVFGDDSTIIIDGVNNTIYANDVVAVTNEIDITNQDDTSNTQVNVKTSGARSSLLNFSRVSTSDLSSDSIAHGRITFSRNDSNGLVTTGFINATNNGLFIFQDSAADATNATRYSVFKDGALGIGTTTPAATLDVQGAIKPGVYADDAARDAAITTPTAGMMVFNTTGAKFQGYDGTSWVNLN